MHHKYYVPTLDFPHREQTEYIVTRLVRLMRGGDEKVAPRVKEEAA